MNLFKGKLTYTLAALAVVYAVVGLALGWIENEVAVGIVWGALTVFGVRRALP